MIQSEPENVEQIRERLRKMSDLELRKYGRAARDLADPKKNLGKPNPPFQVQFGRRDGGMAEAASEAIGA
jgi:hypothetical protein